MNNAKNTMTNETSAGGDGILVFIPSFNDLGSVGEVVGAVLRAVPLAKVLIIDDGSVAGENFDLTQLTDNINISFIRLPENFGLGVCTHIAFDYALAKDINIVVRVDSDNQHPAHEIPRLIDALVSDGGDIAIGIRMNRGDRHYIDGWARRAVIGYFSFLARLVSGGRAPADVNSGFFATNRRAMSMLNQQTLERYPEPQIFVRGALLGLKLLSVGVEQRKRSEGQSSLGIFSAARFLYRFNVFVIGELLRGRDS
jgi:glycosyltransferase involved in cell wall biosynthesis